MFRNILLVVLLTFALLPSVRLAAHDHSGVWRGEWRSVSTGHHGPMRARIRLAPDGTYNAFFTGRFAVVIPFAYRAKLIPTIDWDGKRSLVATKKLGPIMGSYVMQVYNAGNALSGGYRAAKDRGTIRLQKVR